MNNSSAKRLTLSYEKRSRKTLLVRTAAGPTIGFGHLRRALILARRLRGAVRPMFLLDPDDRWSQAHVRHCGFDYRHFDPRRPWPAAEPAAAVLIDTRKRVGLRRLIAAARLRGIPVASIHDLGLAPVASDVVFDGSILPAKDRFPRDDTTFFTGTGYLVLADGCERFHRNDKRLPSQNPQGSSQPGRRRRPQAFRESSPRPALHQRQAGGCRPSWILLMGAGGVDAHPMEPCPLSLALPARGCIEDHVRCGSGYFCGRPGCL